MNPVAAIARVHFGATPLIVDMKRPKPYAADGELIAAATAMASAAATHPRVFTDQQLPVDFVRELRSATDAVAQAALEQEARLTQMRRVTLEIADEGAESVRITAVLNALIVARLHGDAERLAAWQVAKRVSPECPIATVAGAPAAERCGRPRDRAARARTGASG